MTINVMGIGKSISGALFSDENKQHRYALWRIWDRAKDALLFVGLNPSTANEFKDDPTIIRLVNFAKSFGLGGLYAGNLFSIVSANPEVLRFEVEEDDEVNDAAIKRMKELTSTIVVGWGEWGQNAGKRPNTILSLLGEPVYCLKVNQSGEPGHPLYLPRDRQLTLYSRGKVCVKS